MNGSLEYIAAEWRERAKELAAWVMRHMVNRTDVRDDRAIPFTGGWESMMPAIHDFRR